MIAGCMMTACSNSSAQSSEQGGRAISADEATDTGEAFSLTKIELAMLEREATGGNGAAAYADHQTRLSAQH
jgi:hypothetical protein